MRSARWVFLTSSHRSTSVFRPLCSCLPRFRQVCLSPITVLYSTLTNIQFCRVLCGSICTFSLLYFEKGRSRRETASRKVLVGQTQSILYFLWAASIYYGVFLRAHLIKRLRNFFQYLTKSRCHQGYDLLDGNKRRRWSASTVDMYWGIQLLWHYEGRLFHKM